jgi:hypothetical protein
MKETKIHLLYFEGCPNVEKARENLRKAISITGLSLEPWQEVDIKHPETYKGWKGFPSPTILVNGFNIEYGERHAEGTGSCRLGGAPSVDMILNGLKLYKGKSIDKNAL